MKPSDNHDHGMGFWKWGFNALGWGVIIVAAAACESTIEKNEYEDIVDNTKAQCINMEPSKKSSCAATFLNSSRTALSLGNKYDFQSINFLIGKDPVSLKVNKSLHCSEVDNITKCNHKIEYAPS